ncbi:PilZ domain-containing protein [Methylobrevis albus]|uniref:PilZ domain-containing protein n=1 Tax=Methylobrevis albus TaxID=2793297 RepID=A0A931MZF5_9HYPH|nr:PilZ domain-containing protein [Methylobrevis albus]MBH0238975.1 PilZ domain-containing protein [Methylobrevis albus]
MTLIKEHLPLGAKKKFKPERRRFQRVNVSVLGRFMLPNRNEYPCQVANMSPGGVALMTPVTGQVGERVIAYLDHIGRVEGEIARIIDGGFAMTVNATARKRDKLANQLTWLANRHELNLPEDRRHERITPKNPYTQVTLPDGREYRCRIVDVSLSGAAVTMDVRPEIGSPVTLGRMRAKVVRHFEEGVALEFGSLQSAEMITNNL